MRMYVRPQVEAERVKARLRMQTHRAGTDNLFKHFSEPIACSCDSCRRTFYCSGGAGSRPRDADARERFAAMLQPSTLRTIDADSLWLCSTCRAALEKDTFHPVSIVNSLDLDEVPAELAELNVMEQRLISPVHTFSTLLTLPQGQRGNKGIAISFPSNVGDLVTKLPRPPGDEGIIIIRTEAANPGLERPFGHEDDVAEAADGGDQPLTAPEIDPSDPDAIGPSGGERQPAPPTIMEVLTQAGTDTLMEMATQAAAAAAQWINEQAGQVVHQLADQLGALPLPTQLTPQRQQPQRVRRYQVRYEKVLRAVVWLRTHNILYRSTTELEPWPQHVQDAVAAQQQAIAAGQPGADDDGDALQLNDMDHAVFMDTDAVLPDGVVEDELVHHGAARQQAAQRLYFTMKRMDGRPVSMHTQTAIEALAFPQLYPYGKNHWGTSREKKLSIAMYFRSRLMNADGRFESNALYMAWAVSIMQHSQLLDAIQTAIRMQRGTVSLNVLRQQVLQARQDAAAATTAEATTWGLCPFSCALKAQT